MKTIALLNLKGGSGKSTISINLSASLAENGSKVLLADLDPQKSSSLWAKNAKNPLFDVVSFDASNLRKLKSELTSASIGKDYVIFDLPPSLENASLAASLLCDIALIPVTPSPLDLWAAEQAIRVIRDARKERGSDKPRAAIIPNRLQPSTVLAREIRGPLKELGELIAPGICQRVGLAECLIAGKTIGQYLPKSPGHSEFTNLRKFVLTNLLK